MNDELVSIIMPSYNTAGFIGETIKTVLSQTYTNWELLIVDDCSGDDTEKVVSSYLVDDRIHFMKNNVNSGAAFSRNTALNSAKGRWIAFLDSDDLWTYDKLEKQIRFMHENNYSASYTKRITIDEQSNPTGTIITGPGKVTKAGINRYCWLSCPTVMYDRDVVGTIQIKNIKKNNDYAMWLKLLRKCDCYLMDDFAAAIRRREGSLTSTSYVSLIKYYYQMWNYCEEKSAFVSFFYSIRNLFYGAMKKVLFVKKLEKADPAITETRNRIKN